MDLRDEFFHEPGDDEWWSESWYLDVAGEAVQAHARIGFYPNRHQVTVFAFVLDGDGDVYWLREEDVDPRDVHGLVADGDGWRLGLAPVTPGESWTLSLEGEMTRSPDAEAVLERIGEPAEVELEVTARGRHEAFPYGEGRDFPALPRFGRYEQGTLVTGEVTLAGETRQVEAPGERDHSWGRRRWTDGNTWTWASAGDPSGPCWNLLDLEAPGLGTLVNGFWWDGDAVHPLTDVDVATDSALGAKTVEDWARGQAPELTVNLAWKGGEKILTGRVLGTTPLAWQDGADEALMVRSVAEWSGDGFEGRGFIEHKRPRI